jgi:GH24 family phage-related lysozyme (muramidase)
MRKAVAEVEQCAPGLPVEVLAAFSDAAYNLGGKIACDTNNSTAARYLRDGKLIEACNQLPRWDKAKVGGALVALPGLTKRRHAELDLCLKGTR